MLDRIAFTAACATLAIAPLMFVTTLVAAGDYHIVGPIADLWTLLPILESLDRGENVLSLLVGTHGGHHLVLPRLFYLTEYVLLDGSNVFLQCSAAILQLVLLVVVARVVVLRSGALTRTERSFILGLIIAVTFSSTQLDNFVRPWNVHWFVCCTSAVLALASSLRMAGIGGVNANGARAWIWCGVTIVAGICANFSMANGILIWPTLLITCFVLGAPSRLILVIAVAGTVFSSLFVASGQANASAELVTNLGTALGWMLKCLGSPLAWRSPLAGMLLAAIGSLAAAALAARLILRRSSALPAEAFLLGLMTFSLGSVALISLMRTGWAWRPLRYQSVVLLFWLSLALLGLLAARDLHKYARTARSLTLLAVSTWLALVLLPAHYDAAAQLQKFVRNVRRANTALLVGVPYRSEYAHLLSVRNRDPERDSVKAYGELLRRKQLGVFAEGHHELIGLTRDEHFQERDPSGCQGELKITRTLSHGPRRIVRVKGTLTGEFASGTPGLLLLTDPRDKIVGLARPLARPIDLFGWRTPQEIPWIGYANAEPDVHLRAWALTDENEVCAASLSLDPMIPDSQ
jgi:hypothetical protein